MADPGESADKHPQDPAEHMKAAGDSAAAAAVDHQQQQRPCSSQSAEDLRKEEEQLAELIEPGMLESAIKRKTSRLSDEVDIGTKRVRLDAAAKVQSDLEFVHLIASMGYPVQRVMAVFLSQGKKQDANSMLDALQNDEEGGGGGLEGLPVLIHDEHLEAEEEGPERNPFEGEIEPTMSEEDLRRHIESLTEPAPPQLQQMQQQQSPMGGGRGERRGSAPSRPPSVASAGGMPVFVDLTDESTLRKCLHLRLTPTVHSREFVVRTAGLMAVRLEQVSYVRNVARLAEHIFSIGDLYRHYKQLQPSEPESRLVDRAGIERENDAPLGLLIDVAEAFVNNGGVINLRARIEDPACTIKEIGCICSMLADLSWLLFPGVLDEAAGEAAEKMRKMMADYGEKEIREERTRHDIFYAARKVCKGMLKPADCSSPRYEFIERLLRCGNMDAKKNAIDELAIICEHEAGESCGVRRWMKKRNILSLLLADHLDHAEYAYKLAPVMRKIAPVLSEREFRSVWSLQKGRGGITPEIFVSLLGNLASGFAEDQIVMMFKYFKKNTAHLETVPQQAAFLRLSDILAAALNRAIRPGVGARERQIFIDCYIRLLDSFFLTHPNTNLIYYVSQTTLRVSEYFRGLPAAIIGHAIGKMAREVARMRDHDRRFPFYFGLITQLCLMIKNDEPSEYPTIGPLLAHHHFAERSTRLVTASARHTLAEIAGLDTLHQAHEDMRRAGDPKHQQQLADAAAAAAAAAGSAAGAADGAAAAAAEAAAVAPPPSAVTPISNGPSPKRAGGGEEEAASSSSSASSSGSPQAGQQLATAAAAVAPAADAVEPEVQLQQEQQHPAAAEAEGVQPLVTPPSTPEPLAAVSTAAPLVVGSPEWEKELAELAARLSAASLNASFQLIHQQNLTTAWSEMTMGDEPVPGCSVHTVPLKCLEDLFAVMIELIKNGLTKRVHPIWPANSWMLHPQHTTYNVILKKMIKKMESRPVFPRLLSLMCAMPPDTVPLQSIELLRIFIDKCFASSRYNTSTEWLDEVLRFVWRMALSKLSDVRERAITIIQQTLCDRYRTLRLVTIFAVARFNEAIDNLNRFSEHETPLPHWLPDCDPAAAAAEGAELQPQQHQRRERDEAEEEAVDLTLEPAEKRARLSPKAIDVADVERMLRRMEIIDEVTTLEEAELRLSRAAAYLRKLIGHSYAETEPVQHALVLRERALPGEVVQLKLLLHGPLTTAPPITLAFTTNEPLHALVERVRRLLPTSPQVFAVHWPLGFRLRHHSAVASWDRMWSGAGEQLGMNRRGTEEVSVTVDPSPFNDDFSAEASAKRESNLHGRCPRIDEPSVGLVAHDTGLLHVLLTVGERARSGVLQDALFSCVQLLPLHPLIGEAQLMMACESIFGSLEHRPHESLFHLTSLYATLVPPVITAESADLAMRTADWLRDARFLPRLVAMLREIDVISERLSIETMTYFHEVVMALLRLFFLHDSGRHRAFAKNEERLPRERAPIDTSLWSEALADEDVPPLLRSLMQFTWVIVAPRRKDVERGAFISPTNRLALAREKKAEHHITHRRARCARAAVETMLELAARHGSWERNMNCLLNAHTADASTITFWRDLLLNTGSNEISKQTAYLLGTVLPEKCMDEADRRTMARLALRAIFVIGKDLVWGPDAAAASAAVGRPHAIELLRLAEKSVEHALPADFEDACLLQWLELELGFLTHDAPVWNANKETRVQVQLHVSLLQRLLMKLDKDMMWVMMRDRLTPLFNKLLFPFARHFTGWFNGGELGRGASPAPAAIGAALVEGDVRKKYLEFVLFYANEQPEHSLPLLEYLVHGVHAGIMLRAMPIRTYERGERERRKRNDSTNSTNILHLFQRLAQQQQLQIQAGIAAATTAGAAGQLLQLQQTGGRLTKGLMNPNSMCYVNSVLQQLVFMPGVVESLVALGDTDRAFGNLTEPEDVQNGAMLRSLQSLFAALIYAAEPSLSAEALISTIELPSGGSVREQQDCVELFLTLVDKCDSAAEKMERAPVFKQHLEGTMGYEYACRDCGHRHRGADESFTALNLEIHGASVGESLDHCMDGALLEGASAAMCEQCGEKRTTLRMGAFRRAPPTLAIQLKRFSTFGDKLNTKCEIPRDLDLTRYGETVRTASDEQVRRMFGWFDDTQDEPVTFAAPADCPVRWRYRLAGVVVHCGQLGNGHYTSYARERRPCMRGRPWFDRWIFANDERVNLCNETMMGAEWTGTGEDNSASAYLLWYEMIEEDAAAERARVRAMQEEQATVAPEQSAATVPEGGGDDQEELIRAMLNQGTVAAAAADTVPRQVDDDDDSELIKGMLAQATVAVARAIVPAETAAPLTAGTTVAETAPSVEGTVAPPPQSSRGGEDEDEDRMEVDEEREEGEEAMETAQASGERQEQVIEWVDIGLGAGGVLEGDALQQWKRLPAGLHMHILMMNMEYQLCRDVLTETYATFLHRLIENVNTHARKKPAEERFAVYRKLIKIATDYSTQCLWRARHCDVWDADALILAFRMTISNLLKEHVDFYKEWLAHFYDPQLGMISEAAREFTTLATCTRPAVNAFWLLAQHAVTAVREAVPELVQAYCRHAVECMRAAMLLTLDGYNTFFVATVSSPHCLEAYIRSGILNALMHVMFYPLENSTHGGFGLNADFTSRIGLPIHSGLLKLFRDAIDQKLILEEEAALFVDTRLHLTMAPMMRQGEDYLMKVVDLMLVALKRYGPPPPAAASSQGSQRAAGEAEKKEEAAPEGKSKGEGSEKKKEVAVGGGGGWIMKIAQAVLRCLKTDPNRAGNLLQMVMAVTKSLGSPRGADFCDEILGKREADAAENGLIYPGLVYCLEAMVSDKRGEARSAMLFSDAIERATENSAVLAERAAPYAQRLEVARVRAREWKEEEIALQIAAAAEEAMRERSGMLLGADTIGNMLPLNACGPIDRPSGHSGRDFGMQVSEDEMDEDEDEMLSEDEEDYSEGEAAPVNLVNHRR